QRREALAARKTRMSNLSHSATMAQRSLQAQGAAKARGPAVARAAKAAFGLALAIGCVLTEAPVARGQVPPPPGVTFKVRGANDRLEITVNGSKVVEFPFEVPRMMVNNPEIIRVSPISSKSIQLSALRAGVTQLNVWDSD